MSNQQSKNDNQQSNWFASWFDTPYYHILYKDRNYREAQIFMDNLTHYLNLPEKAKVLDLACGKGRHSIYLNQLGFDVIGADLSENSIEEANKNSNATLHFEVHDMREPFEAKFDAIFNLFTSFGYFDSQDDDRKVFKSVSDVLKSDGFFVLDYLNENYVRKTIVSDAEIQRGGIDFTISKKIEDQHIVKDIKFSADGQDFNFFEKVKLHTPDSIQKYAEDNGFERVKIWGDYQLNDFDAEVSPRCINLFKKK